MSPYLTHLLSDLESIIVARWRECPPHFWVMGVPDPYLVLPLKLEGLERPDPNDLAPDLPAWMLDEDDEPETPATRAALEEAGRYVEDIPTTTMFDHFGLRTEEFPPADMLTDEQLGALVTAIRRLWATFNFTAVLPDGLPPRLAYPALLKKMAQPAMLMAFGHIGVEFCHYEPAECPWSPEYCSCKKYLENPTSYSL